MFILLNLFSRKSAVICLLLIFFLCYVAVSMKIITNLLGEHIIFARQYLVKFF